MKEIFLVSQEESGKRLDIFLNEKLEDVTRSQIKKTIDEGLTTVNGESVKSGKILKLNDTVEFELFEVNLNAVPENLPLDIVFEDEDIAIINKQKGMTVHPAPGNYTGTLVNALLYHFENVSDIGGPIRPGIVHRIDKDTSGLLVVAKNNLAHINLAKQIAEKTCKRTYLALIEGNLKEDSGLVKQPIGRSKHDRKKMAVDENGKNAVTHYKVLERYNGYCLVQFDLETGRTHQIRVHCKWLNHPIVGDPVYGYEDKHFKLTGQLLHAYKLKLIHPKTNKLMEFCAELPDYFENAINLCKKL